MLILKREALEKMDKVTITKSGNVYIDWLVNESGHPLEKGVESQVIDVGRIEISLTVGT